MSSSAILPPQQHSQPSRKGKKSWRKHIDVTDVETGLDEIRQEIIHHGAPLASQPSEKLFVLDTTGDVHQRLTYQRESGLKKPLKAEQIIARRSAVQSVDSRKRSASQLTNKSLPDSKRVRDSDDFTTSTSTSTSTSTTISRAHLERLREIAYSGAMGPKHDIGKADDFHERAANNELADPWAVPTSSSTLAIAKAVAVTAQDDLSKSADLVKAPVTLKYLPVTLSSTGKRIPAVQKPDPGRSYNPLFTDWDQLVSREGEREVAIEKKRLDGEDEMLQQQARSLASAAEADAHERENELYDDSEWEGFATDAEDAGAEGGAPGTEVIRLKQKKVKSKAERNKVNRRKEAERLKIHQQNVKVHGLEQEKVKGISYQMAADALVVREKAIQAKRKRVAREKKSADKDENNSTISGSDSDEDDDDEDDEEEDQGELSEDGMDDSIRRRRFGSKTSIPKRPLELLLVDELQDSLLKLKPEGNLMFDRYWSALVRGKMEVRTRFQHKKPKRKATEKWTYKDFKI